MKVLKAFCIRQGSFSFSICETQILIFCAVGCLISTVASAPLPQGSLDHLIIPYEDSPVDYGTFYADQAEFNDEPLVSFIFRIHYYFRIPSFEMLLLLPLDRSLPATTLARSGKVITFKFLSELPTQLLARISRTVWKKASSKLRNSRSLGPVLFCNRFINAISYILPATWNFVCRFCTELNHVTRSYRFQPVFVQRYFLAQVSEFRRQFPCMASYGFPLLAISSNAATFGCKDKCSIKKTYRIFARLFQISFFFLVEKPDRTIL